MNKENNFYFFNSDLKNNFLNFFFLKYKIKCVILKLNYLKKYNIISKKKQKVFIYSIKYIENLFTKNKLISINFEKLIDNFSIILFKNKVNFNLEKKVIIKLYILEEIEKISIIISFIRKILIVLAEKNIDLIYFKKELNKIVSISEIFLFFDDIFKNNHLNFLILKKKIKNNFNFFLENLLNLKFKDSINLFKENNLLDNDYLYFFFYVNLKTIIGLEKICTKMIKYFYFNSKNSFFYKINLQNFINKLKNLITKYINYNNLYINLKNNFEIQEILIDVIYNIKNYLEYYKKIILNMRFNFDFNITDVISKEKTFFYYLKKKNICKNDCLNIIKKITKYMMYNNLTIYNITLKELKVFSPFFEEDIYFFLIFPFKVIKKNKKKYILKKIQKNKFILNNLIIKFKI